MLPKAIRQAMAAALRPDRPVRRSGLRTLVVSDLHLGAHAERDVLREPGGRARRCSTRASPSVDRLVLLGDVLELRHGPCATRWPRRAARWRARRGAGAGREVVIVPGNHDHQLLAPWLERAGVTRTGPPPAPASPLGLETRSTRRREILGRARAAGWPRPASRVALPGRLAARRRVRDPRPLRRPSTRRCRCSSGWAPG